MAATSCKEVRDILSNECSGTPQSGTYWITVTDPHTGDNRTMRVGQKHTCLGVIQVGSRAKSKHNTDKVPHGDRVYMHTSVAWL